MGWFLQKPSSEFLSILSGWLSSYFIVHSKTSIKSNDVSLKYVSHVFLFCYIHNQSSKDGNTNFGNIYNDRTIARATLLFRRLFLALIKWKAKALLHRSQERFSISGFCFYTWKVCVREPNILFSANLTVRRIGMAL